VEGAMKELLNKLVDAIIEEWLKARTVFAMMFYATLCMLILKGIPVPDILKEIVSFLMGFYFGQKQSTKPENGGGQK
jgi:5-bromo-4-chloroindolyl phosphate hydrolysis protein